MDVINPKLLHHVATVSVHGRTRQIQKLGDSLRRHTFITIMSTTLNQAIAETPEFSDAIWSANRASRTGKHLRRSSAVAAICSNAQAEWTGSNWSITSTAM